MATIRVALLAICLPLTVFATISQDFQDFIKKEYGESALKQLARLDLSEQGSFGGGTHKAGEKTAKTPVIFIHGVTHYAGKLSAHRQYFLQHGYKDEEVYAPTFGGAGKVIMIYETMTCDKVKTVRAFIEAVWAYTNSTVDVVAYSQGVPISRKAILGGKCVDTGEDIGPPMTSLVRTYIGVAGPNNGCKVCYMTFGSCNTENGLHCTSKYLADINSKQGYEGSKIYVMLSRQDDIVGYEVCGKVSPLIAGATATYEKNGVNHLSLCMESFDMQYNILNTGKP